ncbi:MAG: exo-alpha-sialidase [Phycisphaeraceae bacterium]|nr:exo-alpha-sialidase [Phycisphaeraceae bacterium]
MNASRLILSTLISVTFAVAGEGQTTLFNGVEVPGVVIDHVPQSTGRHYASPTIAILPDCSYVAAHDISGKKGSPDTVVFRSTDRGLTWTQISTIHNQFWSNLFVHRGDLYIIGPSNGHGDLYIRRSTDGGQTWTTPTSAEDGIIRTKSGKKGFHTGPMPMLIAHGRIWRAVEDNAAPGKWPEMYRAGMISAPVDSDLLQAASWTQSNMLPPNPDWLPYKGFLGWLEGNAVLDRSDQVVNVLRVDVGFGKPEVAAIARMQSPERISFDPQNDIIPMPGGAKKFNIRYHEGTDAYWTLANIVNEQNYTPVLPPRWIRNMLAVLRSDNLKHWTVEKIVLKDLSDVRHIGFHYVDWQFDGRDMIGVARTAFPDGEGGASDYHNANFFNFYRFENVIPEPSATALIQENRNQLTGEQNP